MSLTDDLRDRVVGLALDKVDIIFVKERHLYDRLCKARLPAGSKEIPVLLVQNLHDLKALSHQDMRKLGWVREEKLTSRDAVKILDRLGYDVQMEDM